MRSKPLESVHLRWRQLPVSGAPRILQCAYCVLLEWEHENLEAPFWRLYFNEKSGASLLLPHERIDIEPGRIVLIPPHTVFGTACRGPVGHLYVHFALALDRMVPPGRIFVQKPDAKDRRLVQRIIDAAEGSGEPSPIEVAFVVQALVNAALTRVPSDYWVGRLTDPRIAQALELLGQEGRGENNAELARSVGMNTNAFIRKFERATGHTPHQYRLRLRVDQAAGWLREGRMTIEEIAQGAGFCDRFHFSRVFKQVTGLAPARYRRQCQTHVEDA